MLEKTLQETTSTTQTTIPETPANLNVSLQKISQTSTTGQSTTTYSTTTTTQKAESTYYGLPQLVVSGPMFITPDEMLEFKVTDQFGTAVGQVNVVLRNPSGDVEIVSTDENGKFKITQALAGMWKITAVKDGYDPATKNILSADFSSPEVIVVSALAAALILLLIYTLSRILPPKGKGVFIEPLMVMLMVGDGRINDIKNIYTLPVGAELYPELIRDGKIKTVKITDRTRAKADRMKHEYTLTDDTALTLALAKQKRAKKAVITYDVPEKLKKELAPTQIIISHNEANIPL